MLAEQRLREGKLLDALDLLQEEVKRSPGQAKLRVFLFQSLVVLGRWERALKQLQVAAQLDPIAIPMAQAYRELVRCEILRSEVFAGKRTPVVLGEPPEWVAKLIQALALDAEGRGDEADALRGDALGNAESVAGTLNGERIEWVADADTRVGPTLECYLRGRYHWIPYSRVAKLKLEAPTDLRDLVWLPGIITLRGGEEQTCFVPSRYADSQDCDDDNLRLARETHWEERGPHTLVGKGQRMTLTDKGESPLFELRELVLDEAPDAQVVGAPDA